MMKKLVLLFVFFFCSFLSLASRAAESCAVSLEQSSVSVSANAGTTSLSIIASSSCTWSAKAVDKWISFAFLTHTTATGNGRLYLVYDANSTPSARTGTIQIGGKTFTVTQAGTCNITLGAATALIASAGNSVRLQVRAPSACSWSARPNVGWIQFDVLSSHNGNGNGELAFVVAPNPDGAPRIGTIVVNDHTLSLWQAGAGAEDGGLLGNPGFEQGSAFWSAVSSSNYPIITTADAASAHSGNSYAWLAGYDGAADSVRQDFSVPANAEFATVEFWYRINGVEPGSAASPDALDVELVDITTGARLALLTTLNAMDVHAGWSQSPQFDVSAYRGRTIGLRLAAKTEANSATSFLIDDLRVATMAAEPAQPAIREVVAGSQKATIFFTPSEDLTYTARCEAPAQAIRTAEGGESPITVLNLVNGASYTCTLTASNSSGSVKSAAVPVVPSAVRVDTNAVGARPMVAAGNDSALFLRNDGSVWMAGYHRLNRTSTGTPVQVAGLDARAVAVGDGFWLAVTADGAVAAWGGNASGQLGLGSTNDAASPTLVPGLSKIRAVAANACASAALGVDGRVWWWGCGQSQASLALGLDKIVSISLVAIMERTTSIAVLAAKADGTAVLWMNGTATTVAGLTGVKTVSLGNSHALALRSDGSVWSWWWRQSGPGDLGQLGYDGKTAALGVPARVAALRPIVRIAAGRFTSLVLAADGSVWAWGMNISGELGVPASANAATALPTQIILPAVASAIAAGEYLNGFAVIADGSVYGWGNGQNGMLANRNWNRNCGINDCVTKKPTLVGEQVVPPFGLGADRSGLPDLPSALSATAGNGMATVSFVAPAGNRTLGELIYTVTAQPGGLSASGSASPLTVTGLSNGIAYSFVVSVTNVVGSSASDHASNVVTPSSQLSKMVTLEGRRSEYEISRSGTRFVVRDIAGRDGVRNFDGFERLLFADTAVALDVDGNPGIAYRLYQAAFNRVPDAPGLGYWISFLDGGSSIEQMAASFIASTEFQSMYGANMSDDAFVTALYKNVLHRLPDPAGNANWLAALRGGVPFHQLLLYFSESAENMARLKSAIDRGIAFVPYSPTAAVMRTQERAAEKQDQPIPAPAPATLMGAVDHGQVSVSAASQVEGVDDMRQFQGLWEARDGLGLNVNWQDDALWITVHSIDGRGLARWYELKGCAVNGRRCAAKVFAPLASGEHEVGTAVIEFEGHDTARLTYNLGDGAIELALERAIIGRGRFVPDIDYSARWLVADQRGSVAVSHRFDSIVATLYAFKGKNDAVWYTSSNCRIENDACQADLLAMRPVDAGASIDARHQMQPVGTVAFSFADAYQGLMQITIDGKSERISIVRPNR